MVHHELKEICELMGENSWPYGFKADRDTLKTMTQLSYEQELIDTHFNVGELFTEETSEAFTVQAFKLVSPASPPG